MGYEAQLEQAPQRLINLCTTHAQSLGHAFSAVEGGAVSIGGQGEQDEYGSPLGAESRQPVLAEQAIVKPAEAAGG